MAVEIVDTPVISVRVAALLLGISPQTVYRHIRSGDIESIKIGRTVKVLKAPLLEKFRLNTEQFDKLLFKNAMKEYLQRQD